MKYKKGLIPTFLVVALLVTGVWGYQQYREKKYYSNQLLNQYQRMFYDMKDNIETVQTSLSKSLVSNSKESDVLLLSQIYQQAYFAHDKLSQLPMGHASLDKTEKFLNQVADYSYTLIDSYVSGNRPDNRQRQELFRLQDYTEKLSTELNDVHERIMKGNISLFTLQGQKNELKKANKGVLETRINKYEENQMTEYPELIYDGPFSDKVLNVKPKGLGKEEVSIEEAEKIALDFIGVENPERVDTFNKGEGSKKSRINSFTFKIKPPKQDSEMFVGVSVIGGKVVWMEKPRDIKNKKISDKEAQKIAKEYLDKNGYTNMQPNYSTSYDNAVLFNFVYEQEGIPIYTDLIKVKVALDTGEIIGLDAAKYLKSHVKRDFPQPKLTKEEAQEKIRVEFEITDIRLAVIPDRGNNQILCYEFSGKYKGADFIVYINALNGRQEEILKIIKDENGTLMI